MQCQDNFCKQLISNTFSPLVPVMWYKRSNPFISLFWNSFLHECDSLSKVPKYQQVYVSIDFWCSDFPHSWNRQSNQRWKTQELIQLYSRSCLIPCSNSIHLCDLWPTSLTCDFLISKTEVILLNSFEFVGGLLT